MIRASVDGIPDVMAALGRLKAAAARKVMRSAVTQGTKRVYKLARKASPKDSKTLQKSLGQKVIVYRGSGTVVGIAGPREGFAREVDGRKRDPIRYAHIVERGRKGVRVRKARVLSSGKRFFGQAVRPAPPQPFLGPAIRSPEIGREVEEGARKALAKVAVKEAARGNKG